MKTCNLFKEDLDLLDLVEELDSIEQPDCDVEWEQLKNNYLKLKYINQIVKNSVTIEYNKEFLDLLNEFLTEIEPKTKRYMETIIWDDRDSIYYHHAKKIKKLFEGSLKIQAFPVKKMRILLNGYRLLLDIAEDARDEYVRDDQIDDDDFLEKFEPPTKKARY